MVYRFSIAKNPLAILLLTGGLLLVAAAVLLLFVLALPLSLLFAAVLAYVAYSFFRQLYFQTMSRIITHDDGVSTVTALGEKITLPWNLITHAGRLTLVRGKQAIFLYAESIDQLVTFPADYEGFGNFVEEVEARVALPEVDLTPGQTLKDYLRNLVLPR